jgi:hypothetical protein
MITLTFIALTLSKHFKVRKDFNEVLRLEELSRHKLGDSLDLLYI